MTNEEDLVYRLRKRAEVRRVAKGRKSVEEGKPDRIADILEEAATEIARLRSSVRALEQTIPYDDSPMIKMFRD